MIPIPYSDIARLVAYADSKPKLVETAARIRGWLTKSHVNNRRWYIGRAEQFIAAATSVAGLQEQWCSRSEREIRGFCRIVEEEFEYLKLLYDTKLDELRSRAKGAVMSKTGTTLNGVI